jgi:hypothetical protein
LLYWIGSVVYGTAAYSLRYYYEATFAVCLVAAYGVVAWADSLRSKQQAASAESAIDPAIQSRVSERTVNLARQNAVPIDYLNGVSGGRAPRAKASTFAGRLQLAWDKLWPGYIVVLVACAASLTGYTPARFQESVAGWPNGLFRYNKVGRNQLDAINEMRAKSGNPNQPVLIIVLHNPNPAIEDNWRDYGAAMAYTSPYLDSDIIVARVFEKEDAPDLIRRFPGRLVLYQIAENLYFTVEAAIAGATAQSQAETPSQ